MKLKGLYIITLLLIVSTTICAQKRAWEFGLGYSGYQFDRITDIKFTNQENSYFINTDVYHIVHTLDIYLAKELSDYFALDLQTNLGFTNKYLKGSKYLVDANVGFQYRLGKYFKSSCVDPYVRAGIGYMHKEFEIDYSGTNDNTSWNVGNYLNKDGKDRKHHIPLKVGVGINMWLSDRWGLGMQGDYVIMPYLGVPNCLEGTMRVMYRLGGKTKKRIPTIEYVEKIVEREKIIEVEKIVEKIVIEKELELVGLFGNIHFDFDKDVLTSESIEFINKIAKIIKRDEGMYLITGFTDIKGAYKYNINLSINRAKRVVDQLIKLGVDSNCLKYRGVASKIAIAKYENSDYVREGDRKVIIEVITNSEYWENL